MKRGCYNCLHKEHPGLEDPCASCILKVGPGGVHTYPNWASRTDVGGPDHRETIAHTATISPAAHRLAAMMGAEFVPIDYNAQALAVAERVAGDILDGPDIPAPEVSCDICQDTGFTDYAGFAEDPCGCNPGYNSFLSIVHGSPVAQAETTEQRLGLSLPDADEVRGDYPMADGLLDYFPMALAYVAWISKVGNDQHNPGQPMHWARDKSTDHANKIIRHCADRGRFDSRNVRHTGRLAWRALAMLQTELEQAMGLPQARASVGQAPAQ